ncbi:hypothetical protein [Roseovarius sp.]|uniref:hypothetical protein n=1 Tax=Roseovarius sp. TaxID=1486281 RepID=UPI003A97F1A7
MTDSPDSPVVTPAPLAEGIWGLTGAYVSWRGGVAMPLRTVVIELPSNHLWVYAPGPLPLTLRDWLAAQGRVAHLVLPHAPDLPHLPEWQAEYPGARVWRGAEVKTASWCRQIKPLMLEGTQTETVYLHQPSRSAILSRLIMAVETAPLPVWTRPLIWLAGIDDSDGKPPLGLAQHLGGRKAVGDLVEELLDWGPERLILTHGRCYLHDASGELKRAFRRLMRDRLWDRALSEARRR